MTLKAKTCFFLACFVLLTGAALAEDPDTDDSFSHRFKNIGFHLGGLTEFYNAIQVDTQGQKKKFDFDPLLGASTDIELTETWAVVPEFIWVLPREAGDEVTKNLFMLRLDGAYRGSEWWRLRFGTSLMINNIRGTGGTKEVRNGGGTSDFYIPPESKTSVNNTVDLGAEVYYEKVSFRAQSYIYALTRNDRRQISYSLIFSYYYDLEKKP